MTGNHADLEAPYRRYIADVSPAAYAISLPLARFLWRLAHDRRPRRLLDLGSGFSSYVFRRYAAEAAEHVDVWSVDDDPHWLARTSDYLSDEGVATDELHRWQALPPDGNGFDLVLHDLGTVASRIETVGRALTMVRPGGALVLDDMDVEPYREHVARMVEAAEVVRRDVVEETLDPRGRFAWVILRS